MENIWELHRNMDLWFLALPLGSVSTCAWKKNRVVGLRISTTGLKQFLLSDFKTTVFTCHLLLMMSWFWQSEHPKKKSPSESQFASKNMTEVIHVLYTRQPCSQVTGDPQCFSGWPVKDFNHGCSLQKLLMDKKAVAAEPLPAMCPLCGHQPGTPKSPHAQGRLLPSSDRDILLFSLRSVVPPVKWFSTNKI